MLNPLGPIYSFQFVFFIVCIIFYYKAAEMEDVPILLWVGPSIGLYLLTWRVLGWGVLGCLLGQAALLLGIAVIRVIRDDRTGGDGRRR